MREDYTSGWACMDCVLLLGNGDHPDVPGEALAAYLACVDERTSGYHVSLGMVQEEHDPECPRFHGDTDIDCDCGTYAFSSTACSVCGSTLAGEREAVTFWPDNPVTGTGDAWPVPALAGDWPAEVTAALAG